MRKKYSVKFKQILRITLFLLLFFSAISVQATCSSGIKGNGTNGINININAAPYTTFATYSYGQYAYGKEGCAWFASARVKELTGKGSTIFSGWAWYHTQYGNYGFSIGSTPRAKSLACYGNHVAVVEAVNGDTITVSQGGMGGMSDAAHGYCIISTMSRAQLESQGGCGEFYGYVYLGEAGDTTPPTISDIRIVDKSSTGFTISCTLPSVGIKRVTFPTWPSADDSGSPVWHEGTISGNTATCRVNISDHGNKVGLYIFHIYGYDSNNNEYASGGSSVFLEDEKNPVISNIQISDVSEKGFTVSCDLEREANIKRILFPTWPSADDSGEPIWHEGTISGNTATCRILASDHGNKQGVYALHIYAYTDNGAEYAWGTATATVEKIKEYKSELESPKSGETYCGDVEINGWAICGGTGISHVTAQVNGVSVDCPQYERKEIAQEYPGYPTGKEGFRRSIPEELLVEGENTVEVIAYHEGLDYGIKTIKFNYYPNKHSYTSEVIKEASCLEAGVRTYTCSKCGNSYAQVILATGHVGETEIRNQKEATETEEGYTGDVYCKDCGTMLRKGTMIPMINPSHTHDYTSAVTKSASCLESGIRTYTCSTCGGSYTEEIPATGHVGELEIRNQKAATIAEEGYTGDIYCKDCNTMLQKGSVIPKLSHTHEYTEIVTEEAGCLTKGLKTYVCGCGDIYTEEIPATGHVGKLEIRNQKEATVTEEGYTGDIYCKDCETMIQKGSVIPKLPHTHAYSSKVTKAATCLEKGVKTFTCKCGDTYTEEIPATGHSSETVVKNEIPATTETVGYTGDICCSVCSEILEKGTVIEKLPETVNNPVGTVVTVSGMTYKVTVAGTDGVGEVVWTGGKKKSTVTIPSEIQIGDGRYTVTEIADKAFYKNTKITTVTIPKTVTRIGKNAFYGCTKLKRIKGAAGVETIEDKAFYGCSKLSKTDTFENVKVIGNSAFAKCKELTAISTGDKLEKIGKSAFSGCAKLKKITLATTKLQVVGNKAFAGIHKSAQIRVPAKSLKKYQKLLKNKGQKSSVKIVKK